MGTPSPLIRTLNGQIAKSLCTRYAAAEASERGDQPLGARVGEDDEVVAALVTDVQQARRHRARPLVHFFVRLPEVLALLQLEASRTSASETRQSRHQTKITFSKTRPFSCFSLCTLMISRVPRQGDSRYFSTILFHILSIVSQPGNTSASSFPSTLSTFRHGLL